MHLSKRGLAKRLKRGVYELTEEGLRSVSELEEQRAERRKQRKRRRAIQNTPVPELHGVSRFLRSIPSSTMWLKTLLCAYYLRKYCGMHEFNREMIEACFRRARGQLVPRSLPTLLSQTLSKKLGYLCSGSRRGWYVFDEASFLEFSTRPYVQNAERRIARLIGPVDEDAREASNRGERASA